MAWKAFNSLLDDPRLLVLDSRPARAFLDRHIKGSICVRIASNGSTLEHVAGPGPPAWSQDCWWGRNVLVVSPIYISESKMLKDMQLDSGTHHDRKRKRPRHSRDDRTEDGVVDEVIKFLLSENRVKSLKILEIEDGVIGVRTCNGPWRLCKKLFFVSVNTVGTSVKARGQNGQPTAKNKYRRPRLRYLPTRGKDRWTRFEDGGHSEGHSPPSIIGLVKCRSQSQSKLRSDGAAFLLLVQF
ncbi:unnamed protein product [Calypogeia fissa]